MRAAMDMLRTLPEAAPIEADEMPLPEEETPYEVRLYTNHKELLETIPLKGGALDAGNNPTKGNNTGKRSTGNNNAGAENK